MIDFSDRTRTGISILTSAADPAVKILQRKTPWNIGRPNIYFKSCFHFFSGRRLHLHFALPQPQVNAGPAGPSRQPLEEGGQPRASQRRLQIGSESPALWGWQQLLRLLRPLLLPVPAGRVLRGRGDGRGHIQHPGQGQGEGNQTGKRLNN